MVIGKFLWKSNTAYAALVTQHGDFSASAPHGIEFCPVFQVDDSLGGETSWVSRRIFRPRV